MANLTNAVRRVVGQLLGVLSPRNRDIISRRFGLKTGKKETLESIGQSYGITRERVRQIEEVSLKQIKENLGVGAGSKIKPFINLAENILEEAGGVIKESDLFVRFSGNDRENPANAALVFFLTLDGKLKRVAEDDNFYAFWGLSDQSIETFKRSIRSFIDALAGNKLPVAESAVADFYEKSGVFSKSVSPTVLASYLSISKNVAKNIFGQVGLTSWPEIKPRGVRDKAFLVLKKNGSPKHFREIAQMINAAGFSDREVNPQTVHNELIKDKRFVLVGRGIYGLAEWGLKAGTVKDVLIDLLRSAGRPLPKNEIVAAVLSHRMVKENTVVLNLHDPKVFQKKEDGTYTLREA
jgi:hypothetical protein